MIGINHIFISSTWFFSLLYYTLEIKMFQIFNLYIDLFKENWKSKNDFAEQSVNQFSRKSHLWLMLSVANLGVGFWANSMVTRAKLNRKRLLLCQLPRSWYNGYHFSSGFCPHVQTNVLKVFFVVKTVAAKKLSVLYWITDMTGQFESANLLHLISIWP